MKGTQKMKLKSLLFMTAAVLALSACGSTQKDSSSSKVDSSATSLESQSQVDSSSENAQVAAAKLVQGYSSPAQFKYQNMRPTYNYYTTTFSFESLDLYDDGTYQLNNISMTFSGIVLPEEGSDGSGNERENTVTRYYGTYSSEVDDLDADTTHISLSVPDRVVVFGDASVFYDTANWTDKMSAKAGETQQYDANYNVVIVPGEKSAETYLSENKKSAVVADVIPNNAKLDFVTFTD